MLFLGICKGNNYLGEIITIDSQGIPDSSFYTT
jgi:hypothetical protein